MKPFNLKVVKPRELRDLYRDARQRGAEVTYTGSGHVKVRTDSGIVFGSSTGGGHRTVQNIRAKLRGIDAVE